MSALGQTRTFRDVGSMSALPPKADIKRVVEPHGVRGERSDAFLGFNDERFLFFSASCPAVRRRPSSIRRVRSIKCPREALPLFSGGSQIRPYTTLMWR
jgi:hypothetical protein